MFSIFLFLGVTIALSLYVFSALQLQHTHMPCMLQHTHMPCMVCMYVCMACKDALERFRGQFHQVLGDCLVRVHPGHVQILNRTEMEWSTVGESTGNLGRIYYAYIGFPPCLDSQLIKHMLLGTVLVWTQLVHSGGYGRGHPGVVLCLCPSLKAVRKLIESCDRTSLQSGSLVTRLNHGFVQLRMSVSFIESCLWSDLLLGTHNILSIRGLMLGNKLTLETKPQEAGIDVRKELLKFHSSHYSSNVMCLVVLGKGECTCMYMHVCTHTCHVLGKRVSAHACMYIWTHACMHMLWS